MAQPAKEIKGYQLQDLIGEGGFGAVYRAYQPAIKREVAIKVIRTTLANQPEFIRRFETEAQLVARLEHLHIVPLYDFWRDPTGAYLVLRLLRGGSLRDEMEKDRVFSLEDVNRIVGQLSAALSVAHRNGVIHRDLKPANILLDEEQNAYLTDFGIAKDVEHAQEEEDDDDGTVVGTPAYSPPEQLQSLTPTPQSDIYSFGLIIYELLTGLEAMGGSSMSDVIRKQIFEPLPDIDPVEYNIPSVINDILATATAKDPEERYRDIRTLARDFAQATQGHASTDQVIASSLADDDLVVVPPKTMNFSINIDDLNFSDAKRDVVNPYKGLRAFQESDASDFFGRDALTEILITRLEEDRPDARFLAVIGPSGSGKSSVVKAGVIPELRNGRLTGSQNFFYAEMVPGADAIEELESVLLSIAIDPPSDLRDRLQASEAGLHTILQEILPDADSDLFLLIDQFEEIFTQTEDNRVRTHFMNSLQYAVTHPDSRLWAVITIRADFYDRPLLYPQFGELVRERGEIVLPLSRSELEAAIVQPSRNVGVEMETDLINAIINDVQEEPGALPLLQYALTELFDRRDGLLMKLETYLENGGVLGSLARRAEELYSEMDGQRQEAVRQLFLRLVTLGEGTEDTRRRVLWSELVFSDNDDDPMHDVLEVFTKYRLLTGDNDPQTREPTIEVAHEALIRQWQRLRTWLADNRENIRLQRQVVGAVEEWKKYNQDNSYLATGLRLEQFELLAENDDIALTVEEKAYIEASVEQREAIKRAEIERQERERRLEDRARNILRGLVAVMAVFTLIAFVLAAFAFSQQQIAVSAQEDAEREAVINNSISLSNLARFWGRDGEEPLLGLSYAIEANTIPNPPVEVQNTLADLAWQPGARYQMTEHLGEIWGVTYSADGEYIFTGAGSFTGGDDNRLLQWDAESGDLVTEFIGHADRIYSVAASNDGQFVATGSQDSSVRIWTLATGDSIELLGHTGPVFDVMFTNDSTRLITGGATSVRVWDVATGDELAIYEDLHSDIILDMDITSDDSLVFSGDFSGNVRLWRLDTGEVLMTESVVESEGVDVGQITGARFLVGEQQAVTTDQSGQLIVWDVEDDYNFVRLIEHQEAPLRGGVAVFPDGDRVVAGDDNGNLMVWSLSNVTDQPELTLRGHDTRITSLAINATGSEVTTVSFDYTVIIWDLLGRGAEISRYADHDTAVRSAVLSNDGLLIAAGADDGDVIIWDAVTGEAWVTIEGENGTVYDVAFSPDDTLLATASFDGTVNLWNTETGDLEETLLGINAPVRQVAFSPDGSLIAGAGGQVQVAANRDVDNRIIIWDTNGEVVQELDSHEAAVRALVFSPDGSQLLSGSDDTTAILWNVETGEIINTLTNHADSVSAVAFSPDGSRMLTGSLDTSILLWDTNTGENLNRLSGHTSGVRSVAFHPDGVHALSGAGVVLTVGNQQDYELHYWNVNTGEIQRELPGHSRTVRSVVFSTDGQEALSASDDGNVILWHVDTLENLIARIGNNFDIVCVDEDGNDICEDEVITVEDDDTGTTASLSFPSQSVIATPYADGSACLLEAPEANNDGISFVPPNAVVDTSIFAQDGAVVLGYSNGSVVGTPDDWIAAWAQYEADQTDDVSFILLNAGGDSDQQLADIQELLDQGVDALIISPVENPLGQMAELEALIEATTADGIPVIMVGHRTPNPVYTTYVGQDNYEVGCIMGQELAALVDGEGSVGFINAVDNSIADNSFKNAVTTALALFPNISRDAEGATAYSRERASTYTNTVEVVAIAGYVGEITLGAEEGLNSQGLDFVPFVSNHEIELALFAQENSVDGVFIRTSTQMGADAVQTALRILRGGEITQFQEIEPDIIPTSALDNYDLADAPENGYLGDWEDLPVEYYPDGE